MIIWSYVKFYWNLYFGVEGKYAVQLAVLFDCPPVLNADADLSQDEYYGQNKETGHCAFASSLNIFLAANRLWYKSIQMLCTSFGSSSVW